MDRLSRFAIQDVEEPVLARLGERFHPSAANVHVEQDGLVRRVVVPDVMVCLLEVPLQFAGVQREGEKRIGEQVRAETLGAVAEGVGHRDIQQSQFRID